MEKVKVFGDGFSSAKILDYIDQVSKRRLPCTITLTNKYYFDTFSKNQITTITSQTRPNFFFSRASSPKLNNLES
jgi:hypothetical protein